MDYRKHYDSLMKKARERDWRLLPYFERHHIVPRSEGGGNEDTNLIKLTAREHFLAHWFLYREDPSIKSRVFSFWRMCNGRGSTPPEHWLTISSRCYEEARKAHSEAISKALKGKKKTPEHVKKVADKIRGLKRTEEQKAKLRKPHKYSEEGLYRKRASMIGKTPRNIRKVDMLDVNTYDTIRSFSSIKEAAKFVNLVGSNIQVAAKTGSISGGHRWKYSEQVDYKSKEKKTLAKKVKAYRIESPDQIIIFDSMREAFEYTGISKSAIHTRCNRKDNEYKGWCFEYVEK